MGSCNPGSPQAAPTQGPINTNVVSHEDCGENDDDHLVRLMAKLGTLKTRSEKWARSLDGGRPRLAQNRPRRARFWTKLGATGCLSMVPAAPKFVPIRALCPAEFWATPSLRLRVRLSDPSRPSTECPQSKPPRRSPKMTTAMIPLRRRRRRRQRGSGPQVGHHMEAGQVRQALHPHLQAHRVADRDTVEAVVLDIEALEELKGVDGRAARLRRPAQRPLFAELGLRCDGGVREVGGRPADTRRCLRTRPPFR